MNSVELCYLSALELRELYLARSLSPVEVTRAVLDRIEALNPVINAYVTVTAERALADAHRAELAFAGRTKLLPLSGIPYSLKDLTPTKGIRTTKGSLLWKDWVPDFDTPIGERLQAAGGVLLGKTNTPELGWKGESTNRVVGSTLNPWKLDRTPGGSSGGAAAAAAAGLGPLAQGTDGAGSVRIPASFAGVFGLKPSFGLIPYYPTSAVESLAHIGPLTRTVCDGALMLNVMAGPDWRDHNSLDARRLDYLAACDGDIRGLRVAWSRDLGFASIEPEVLRIVEASVDAFRELGCQVIEVDPGFADPWEPLSLIWATGMAAGHSDNFDQVRSLIDPGRAKVAEEGFAISGVDLTNAHNRKAQFVEQVLGFSEQFDLLLTPTVPVTAFAAGADQPGTVAGKTTSYLSWTPYTYVFNLTGQPAATVPCGFAADGLPVGLQIVGRWRDDATVLRAASAFEAARPWSQHRPPVDESAPR
ncbi:MAG TPA: amidase [Nitrolancea sp.]|nr:amidase [Nitrolancea sp.]